MFCSQCGLQIQNDANFCSACGNQVNRPPEGSKIVPEPFTEVHAVEPGPVIQKILAENIECRLTKEKTPITIESYDIIATDKGFVFISIDGYTRLNPAGGLLTIGLVAAFNYFQDLKHGKRHDKKVDNASLNLLLQQGVAILFDLKDSHISVNPRKKDFIDLVSVTNPGSRVTIEGRLIDKGGYKNGSICFSMLDKPKYVMKLLQEELGYEATLRDVKVAQSIWESNLLKEDALKYTIRQPLAHRTH